MNKVVPDAQTIRFRSKTTLTLPFRPKIKNGLKKWLDRQKVHLALKKQGNKFSFFDKFEDKLLKTEKAF